MTPNTFNRKGDRMNINSWMNPHLEKRCSDKDGCGIFTNADIRKGERLAIFGGRVMAIDDMYRIPEALQSYTMQIEERFVLGPAGTVPEDTDFFNHSCDPNSGFSGQIFLVAMRDIAAGEEITFDYGMTVSESVGSNMVFTMNCACNSPLCRKTITEGDWKLPELQERYKGYFSQYIQEKIEMRKSGSSAETACREAVVPNGKKAGISEQS
jgi:hypothetical protein